MPMKKATLILLIVSFFIASFASHARAEVDGAMLLNNCADAVKYMENNKDPSINFASVHFCFGYISSINDIHNNFVSSVACFDPPVFCAPSPADMEQYVKIIVRYLKSHPEYLPDDGSVLALAALQEAFPCP